MLLTQNGEVRIESPCKYEPHVNVDIKAWPAK